MRFISLELGQFRNIKEKRVLAFHKGLNLLRGPNGQGKTNLVEALYFLTQLKSFRTSNGSDLIQKGYESLFLNAKVESRELQHQISLGFGKNQSKLILNGKPTQSSKVRQLFPSLLFSPESLLIIKESPQQRRDLVDSLCMTLYPQFFQWDSAYKKLLRQKKSVLKQLKDKKIDLETGDNLLKPLTQQLLLYGAKITVSRLRACQEIEPLLLQEFFAIMDEHYGNISVSYEFSGRSFYKETEGEIHNAMYKRWLELKDRELASGACLVGPHKHEIHFNFNGQNARFFCSQGQQRAIILAFKMAHTKLHYEAYSEYPILLLDDVLSELDKEKQNRFINYLLSTEAQIFLTTTDATEIPRVVEQAVFEVSGGCFFERQQSVAGGLSV